MKRLVQAYRILASEGQCDGTLGHISLRDADGRGFWIKRADLGMDEVWQVDDLLLVDFQGKVVEGKGALHSEWPVHASVLKRDPRINGVVHTHARHASLLSASDITIEPLTTEGGYFARETLRVYEAAQAHIDCEDVANEVAEVLGAGPAMLLRNHGIVTCGTSVERATIAALYLERAAAIQLAASHQPTRFRPAEVGQMEGRSLMLESQVFIDQMFDYYARRSLAQAGGVQRPGATL